MKILPIVGFIQYNNQNYNKSYHTPSFTGGQDSFVRNAINKPPKELLKTLNLSKYSPKNIDEISKLINEKNLAIFSVLINTLNLSEYDLSEYLYKAQKYTPQEFENIDANIKKGFAEYFIDIETNPANHLKKTFNTPDYHKKFPEFLTHFNYIIKKRATLLDLLRFPLISEKNIEKTFRQMCSLMNNVTLNVSKEFDTYEALKEYEIFFNSNFNELLGMLFYTDKETVLHILDKGYANAHTYIKGQKQFNVKDATTLNKIIMSGKALNKNNEYCPISAKDKLYAYHLSIINRNLLSKSVGEIEIANFLTPIKDGYFVDFNNLKKSVRNKILNKYGLPNEELKKLNPKDLDWNQNWIHLLANHTEDPDFKTLVTESSRGNFVNYITSPDNKYGRANSNTKNQFETINLNYDNWLNGIPPEEFYIDEEKYTISIWKRRPQQDLTIASETNSCTALDRLQYKSMIEYLMNTAFNYFEIKNSAGELVSTARVFMLNEFKPILLIDSIEVNNTFNKKSLNTFAKKNLLAENIFKHIRKFTETLSEEEIEIYFSRENNKLFDSDIIEYPKELLGAYETIGEIVEKKTYCNLITQSFLSFPCRELAYNVTHPLEECAHKPTLFI